MNIFQILLFFLLIVLILNRYINSGFFKRKIISQEKSQIQNIISNLKNDKNISQFSNLYKDLKIVNQSI